MSSRPVVSNASPIIAFGQIDQLQLLRDLFGAIVIPPAVRSEVAPTVTLPAWIKHEELPASPRGALSSTSLGNGEIEAIALARETQASWLLLDERPARRLAHSLGLPVIGTLGILLRAKRKRLILEIGPCLDALLRHDFRLATKLLAQVMRDAGEG